MIAIQDVKEIPNNDQYCIIVMQQGLSPVGHATFTVKTFDKKNEMKSWIKENGDFVIAYSVMVIRKLHEENDFDLVGKNIEIV